MRESQQKKAIVFLTTVFDDSQNGPAVFAQYLWNSFKDRDDIDFHLVGPSRSVSHPKFHNVDSKNGAGIYSVVQSKALEVASTISGEVIFHGNVSHAFNSIIKSGRKKIVQINDYETADAVHDVISNFFQYGARRALSLIWRHQNERNAVRAATVVISNSNFTQEKIRRSYGLGSNCGALRVIHKAVDIQSFERPAVLPKDPYAQPKAGTRLLFVGANWKLKGLREILGALPKLLNLDSELTLSVIGPNASEDLAEINNLAEQYGVGPNVHLVGRIDRNRLPTWYWHSDLMISPTRKEGFGVALLEAMAAGLPVLASPVGAIPELLENGRSGFLLDADQQSWHLQIRNILESGQSDLIIESGIRRAKEFSHVGMLKKIHQLYRDI